MTKNLLQLICNECCDELNLILCVNSAVRSISRLLPQICLIPILKPPKLCTYDDDIYIFEFELENHTFGIILKKIH